MGESFKRNFREAGEYCIKCYLSNLDREEYHFEKEVSIKKSAKNSLVEILGSTNNEEIRKIAEEALKRCEKCEKIGLKDPLIFQYLEKMRY